MEGGREGGSLWEGVREGEREPEEAKGGRESQPHNSKAVWPKTILTGTCFLATSASDCRAVHSHSKSYFKVSKPGYGLPGPASQQVSSFHWLSGDFCF